MRILFLSHYFPPEVNAPASRTVEHSREWVRRGHEVTVVTCTPNHPTGKAYPGYRNRLWQVETVDGIRVVRIWTYLAPNERILRRVLNYVSYLASALVAVPFLPRADVVVSTSPQFFCGLAGYFVSRAKRAPWVLEIRDLWPAAIQAVDAIQNPRVIRLLERLEGWAYRKADWIVPVTESFRRHIQARGVPGDRITVITNGVNLELFCRPKRDPTLEHELGLVGKFVVGYFGTLGMAHRMDIVFEAADLLQNDDRIAFLIVGDGAERARLFRRWRERGPRNIVMLGQQSKERMPALWSMCDASVALMRNAPLFETMIPSKIFESMAMERPIILGFKGESQAIVQGAGCGIVFEPEDPQALADAVRRLAADPEQARAMGRRGRALACERYDRAKLAATFLAVIQHVVRTRGCPDPAATAHVTDNQPKL